MVAYGKLKPKESFKLLALKVVALGYERWSLTRGFNYSDLTWKLLKFGKLVAEQRWSLTIGSTYSNLTWKLFDVFESLYLSQN